jgi:4-amino-4-deoxy-L-arabinose transferase-like glycosyltransferase
MRDGRVLYAVLGLYFAVHVGLRLALPNSLELDEGQQLFLAQWLAVGYDTQPPFYNWLQYGVVRVLGVNVLALTLLKNVLLFASYLLVGGAAFIAISNRALAIIAVLGMLTLPQVAFEAQRDLTHSVAVLFASSLFVYALFATLERGSLFAYALTGVAVGVGLLAKYNFALLPAAALIGVILEPSFRGRLWNWRIIVAILVAGAIVAPHALWFLDHVDLATGRTLGKLKAGADVDRTGQIIAGMFSLVAAFIGFGTLTVAAYWIAFGRRFTQSWRSSSKWTRLVGVIFVVVVVALVGLILFGGASALKDRWLTPYFFILPLYFSLKLDALNETIGNAPTRFGMIIAVIMIAIPIILIARVAAPHWTGRYGKPNVPYGPALETILAEGAHRPLMVLTEDMQLAGNIRLAAPDVPVVVPGYQDFEKGHRFDETRPLLVVWRDKDNAAAPMPGDLARLLSTQTEGATVQPEPKVITKPYIFGRAGDVYGFGYAWVYPAMR